MKRVTLELGGKSPNTPFLRSRLRQGSPDGPRHHILEQRSGLRRRNPTSRAEEPTRRRKTNFCEAASAFPATLLIQNRRWTDGVAETVRARAIVLHTGVEEGAEVSWAARVTHQVSMRVTL